MGQESNRLEAKELYLATIPVKINQGGIGNK